MPLYMRKCKLKIFTRRADSYLIKKRTLQNKVALTAIALGFFLIPFPWAPWCSISIIGAILHSDFIYSARKIYDNFKPALYLLLSITAGLLFSSDYSASIKGTMDLLRGFLAGAAILILLNSRQGTQMLFSAATASLATIFLVHLFFADSLLRSETIFSMELDWFAHPARLAGISFFLMICAIYSSKCIPQRNSLIIPAIIFLVYLQIELWASSRGPILCAFVAIALGTTVVRLNNKAMAASILAMLASAPIILMLISQITKRGLSDSGRFELWKHTIKIWIEYPWLGLGNNVFKQIPNQYLQGGQLQMPHNIYLEVLFSGGALSLTALTISILLIFSTIRKSRHKIHVLSASALIFFFSLGLFDIKFFSSLAGLYIGLGVAMICHDLTTSPKEKTSP